MGHMKEAFIFLFTLLVISDIQARRKLSTTLLVCLLFCSFSHSSSISGESLQWQFNTLRRGTNKKFVRFWIINHCENRSLTNIVINSIYGWLLDTFFFFLLTVYQVRLSKAVLTSTGKHITSWRIKEKLSLYLASHLICIPCLERCLGLMLHKQDWTNTVLLFLSSCKPRNLHN